MILQELFKFYILFLKFFKLGIAKWKQIVYTSSSKRHRAIAKR